MRSFPIRWSRRRSLFVGIFIYLLLFCSFPILPLWRSVNGASPDSLSSLFLCIFLFWLNQWQFGQFHKSHVFVAYISTKHNLSRLEYIYNVDWCHPPWDVWEVVMIKVWCQYVTQSHIPVGSNISISDTRFNVTDPILGKPSYLKGLTWGLGKKHVWPSRGSERQTWKLSLMYGHDGELISYADRSTGMTITRSELKEEFRVMTWKFEVVVTSWERGPLWE